MIWWLSLKENFRRLKLLSNFMLWLYMLGIAIISLGCGIIAAVLEKDLTLMFGATIIIIGLILVAIPSAKLGKVGKKKK